MKQKFKLLTAFMCGAVFFSGVSYAATELKARVTDYKLNINEVERTISNPIVSINGSSYLPVRNLSEEIGFEVQFKDNTIYLNKYEKLPQTIEKNNVKITFHSLVVEDSKTVIKVTAVNKSDKEIRIDHELSRADYNVTDRKMYTIGSISSFIPAGNGIYYTNNFFDNRVVPKGDTIEGDFEVGKIKQGTKNVLIRLKAGKDDFYFYIDPSEYIN